MTEVDPSFASAVDQCRTRFAGWRFASGWYPVTQQAVDEFARSVLDPDPMHVDPEWSRQTTPYGGTIAQGLWTTSMLVKMLHDSGLPTELMAALEAPIGLNYGFDRLRLIEPVRVGSLIQGSFEFRSIELKDDRTALVRLGAVVVTDGAARPAVAADWILAFQRYSQ
jgi:acyl dehydratase